MDATLILIDGDAELLRARASSTSYGTRPIRATSLAGSASAPDCRVRGNEMAPPAAERRRFDPPPDQRGLTRVAPPPKKPPPCPPREASPVGTSTSKAGRRRPKAAQAEAVGVVLCETNPISSKTLAHRVMSYSDRPRLVRVGKSGAAAAGIARAFVGLAALQRQQRL